MATAPIPQPSFLDGTGAFAISDGGQITGSFGDIICVGFFRHSDGSTINFNVPGPFPLFTIPQAINLWGQITGYYRDFVDNTRHGFLRQANSKVSTFDPAGSVDTQATGINLVGQITGFYATSDGVHHGFLRPSNGRISTFDPAGSSKYTGCCYQLLLVRSPGFMLPVTAYTTAFCGSQMAR
jgi:uncharacterized membrane protein